MNRDEDMNGEDFFDRELMKAGQRTEISETWAESGARFAKAVNYDTIGAFVNEAGGGIVHPRARWRNNSDKMPITRN